MRVSIKDLEMNQGQPAAFDNILTAMTAGQRGYAYIGNTDRFHAAGDVQDGGCGSPATGTTGMVRCRLRRTALGSISGMRI